MNITVEQKIQEMQQVAAKGNIAKAQKLADHVIETFPNSSAAWNGYAIFSFQTSATDIAIKSIEKAIKIEPENYVFCFHKVMILERSGYTEKAFDYAKHLNSKKIINSEINNALAIFFNKFQAYEDACVCYERAVSQKPKNVDLLLNLAMTKQYLGEINSAEQICQEALTHEPNNYDLHFFMSHLTKKNDDKNNIHNLKKLIKLSCSDPVKKSKGLYALAKEYEDCRKFSQSFNVRQEAALVYRNSFHYDVNSDLKFMSSIREAYNKEIFEVNKIDGLQNKEPIFVVGLPRTGTTLLERIISSHSKVSSAGELTNFNKCMIKAMQNLKLNSNMTRSEMVKSSVNIDFKKLGKDYIDSSRPITGKKQHFVDKFPQNSLYVGLIHKALPHAKILILERHPMDVCYSVYKQMFTDIYQFSYDFNELALYYIEHQKLIKHWSNILPQNVKVVRYENLVQDLENNAKNIINFCNLEWESSCLEFHKNKEATSTASASQVREKVYTSSIGMWKNYQKELMPLLNTLEINGCLEGWDI